MFCGFAVTKMIGSVILTGFCVLLIFKIILKLSHAKCKSKVSLVGKTALITGGNSGIGLAAAKDLASRGCTIIIADKDDARNTIEQLIRETHNPNISSKIVDFASFKSVRIFADELNKNLEKLHILVNNVGTADMSMEKTEDGIQKIMQINYFSHFLLTHKLLELLLRSTPSRIIYTSSLAAYDADLLEHNFTEGQRMSNWRISCLGSYANSKLAGAIMSKMLAEKLKNSGVISNAYHPGVAKTNIYSTVNLKNVGPQVVLLAYTSIFGKSPEEGAQTLVHLSCSNEVENISGKFFIDNISIWQPRQVYNKEYCEKIWELSEKNVNLKSEEKLDGIIQRWKKKN